MEKVHSVGFVPGKGKKLADFAPGSLVILASRGFAGKYIVGDIYSPALRDTFPQLVPVVGIASGRVEFAAGDLEVVKVFKHKP